MKLATSLTSLCAALTLCAGLSSAAAQDFPQRPVTIIVPFGAGGSTDTLTRGLATEMAKVLGQPVVTQNVGGAAGTIGTARVAASAPDGYTLGMLPVGPLTTQTNLRSTLTYSPASFDYVCLVYANPQAVIVRADSPHRTVKDMLEHARRNPGKFDYGSSGVGSVPHLAVVALAKAAGIEAKHIPLKGDADAILSLLRGDVEMFVSHTAVLASQGEKVRGLGLMADKRLKEFPDLPTLAEQGAPPLSFDVWGGLAVPKGTPAPVIAKLEQACQTGVASESFREMLVKLQTPHNYMGSQAFGRFVAAEFQRYGTLLREAGVPKD